jgi:hypothetical protein
VAAAVVLVAACGGSSARDVVRAAGPQLRAAETARLEFLFTFDLGAESRSFTMRGDGAIDYANERSAATFALPGAVVEIIGAGTDVYLRGPANPFVQEPSTWLHLAASAAISDAEEALGVVTGTDPGKLLANMELAGKVAKVGEERARVRGAPTTQYHADLDPSRAMSQLTFLQRDQIDQLKQQGKQFKLGVDVWIDDDGRPRRLRSVSEVEGVISATFTTEFFDFGDDVAIAVPKADEVGASHTVDSTSELFDFGQRIGAAAR